MEIINTKKTRNGLKIYIFIYEISINKCVYVFYTLCNCAYMKKKKKKKTFIYRITYYMHLNTNTYTFMK